MAIMTYFFVTTAFKQVGQILSREFSMESMQNNIISFANHGIVWCEPRDMRIDNIAVAA